MCQHILYTKLRHRAVVYTINEDATRYEVFLRVVHMLPFVTVRRFALRSSQTLQRARVPSGYTEDTVSGVKERQGSSRDGPGIRAIRYSEVR